MPLSEFNEWFIYYHIEPFGDLRGDIQAGVVASTLVNVHKDKNSKPMTPMDFVPNFYPESQQPKTPQEDLLVLLTVQATQNALIAAHAAQENA